jgi:hypothetical protein
MLATSCGSVGSRQTTTPPAPKPATDPRAAIAGLVAKIRTADYEGNRPELAKLFEEMAPYTHGPFASRAYYWRGFAMWRRALNGFNDNAGKAELAADLKSGIVEFEAALAADPEFTDTKIGLASCSVNLSVLSSPGPERMALFRRQWDLLGEAQKEAPKNPRLAWVLGAAQFYAPPALGGSQEKGIETYETGLESARQEQVADPLDPSWGEPELLMNLAFSNLNRAQPDLDAADRYARAALAQVPNWRYVRDILIPQIQAAKKKAGSAREPRVSHPVL